MTLHQIGHVADINKKHLIMAKDYLFIEMPSYILHMLSLSCF